MSESDVIDRPQTNELTAAIQQEGLPEKMGADLLEVFQPFFNEARPLVEEAMKITVTGADQLTEMRQAREIRLKLVKIRTGAEKARKDTKDDALKQCRAIDNVGRVVKDMIQTAEDILKEHETFAERAEAERKDKLKAERARKLEGLCDNPGVFDLANMTEGDFENLLAGQKAAKREKEEAAARAKAEAEAAEKARREELAKAAAEAEEARKAKAAAEAELAAERAKAQKEREAAERAAAAERAKAEEAARVEREAREKAERELQAQRDAAAKAERDRLAAEAKAAKDKADAERKVAAAPDAEKLWAFVDRIKQLADDLPQTSTSEGAQYAAYLHHQLADICKKARERLANGL